MGWSGRDERVADLFFLDQTAEGQPAEEGLVRYVGSDLVGFINGETKSLTAGAGGGITPAQHEVLDTLVHNVAESCYFEVTRTGNRVSDLTWYTDAGKGTKVREINITRTSGKVSQIVMKQYDAAGDPITGQTLTGTVARTGGRVDSITWVES